MDGIKTIRSIEELEGEGAAAVVALVDRLVWELGNSKVRYCHWKSNRQLNSALAAEDDLDLLISIDDKLTAEKIFLKLGFKQFVQVPTKRYNGITDFIGFDPVSGRLVHLHTHYRLTLGGHRLKGYHLPWENGVLETAEAADRPRRSSLDGRRLTGFSSPFPCIGSCVPFSVSRLIRSLLSRRAPSPAPRSSSAEPPEHHEEADCSAFLRALALSRSMRSNL